MACGPQHLSSARERQSCGHTFIVTPMTLKPCCFSNQAATLESTPPLMPTTTRAPWGTGDVRMSECAVMEMRAGQFRARMEAANGFSGETTPGRIFHALREGAVGPTGLLEK